jgi:hypothetical protein
MTDYVESQARGEKVVLLRKSNQHIVGSEHDWDVYTNKDGYITSPSNLTTDGIGTRRPLSTSKTARVTRTGTFTE